MTLPAISIPLPLRHALDVGECVLFLGAGVGQHLFRPDGSPLPDASELARSIATHFSLDTASDDLSKVAELLQIRNKKDDLEDFIRKLFSDLTPDKTICWLCSRRWRAIYTTNYDRGIERSYELLPDPPQQPISISRTAELVHIDARFEVPIYHIHGAMFGHKQHIVISQTDYTRFREERRMLFELLKTDFATSTFLYIGYSNRDPNWALLLNEITEEFQPSRIPSAFRVAPNTARDDAEILKARGINTIDADLEQFVTAATIQLEPFNHDTDRLKAIQKTVPNHLLEVFEKNPAPVARFIASWQYVNQAPFSDTPNSRQFFRGDQPNWAVIGAGIPFQRDIETDLYDDILDYITSTAKKPSTFIVLGPAGYGITTILMNIAVRLVNERAAQIYFLKAGTDVLEGDVDFAISATTSDTACFFIDNAADHSMRLYNTIARLRDAKRPAVFVFGARMNEWRQRHVRMHAKEYIVEPLSSAEIDRLLKCLDTNGELNKLEPLSQDLRRAVIQEKHGNELLVVMREATEDKRFDAILEDEFFCIKDDKCREIYLIVCCFHQHGSYVRDALLCDITGLSLVDFRTSIKGVLDGVVLDECIDETSGRYAYRARHRTIASIVWNRCGEATQKDNIIQRALKHLNLNLRADVHAFEKFIRNDALIDSIHGLENKIKFFDLACRKDPESPYVRQHYARMLYRAERLELALAQVEQGIAINTKEPPRVLIHTKGTILSALAIQNESMDIGRRRLVQAEDAFRRAMQLDQRDDYTYQALASLYLEWAKKTDTDTESATYLEKAEGVISEGLRRCREKDALWIVSANIEQWLGNQPSRLRALEKAVKESPGSIIARYLLGKEYRRLGKYKDAITVLEHNIKHHPDEFRSCIEYALSLLASGGTYQEAIAIVEIASVTGLTDARYIAHLGGMYFLNMNFTETKRVFDEALRRELPSSELQSVVFRPRDPRTGDSIRLTGQVLVRRPTYSLIECEGYRPPFFCHSSKYRRLTLKEGMRLSFEVGFSPRGPVALDPTEVT